MDSECVIFYGREGEPCERFIRAVRKVAFEAGKIRDSAWMADFASTCLDGPALRYYETLIPDVKTDWQLLYPVLLTKYPLPDRVDVGIQTKDTSPFQASSSAEAAALPPPQRRRGRIRVTGDNSVDFGYIGGISTGSTDEIGSGASVSEALQLSYISSGKLYEIEIECQGKENQLLGLHWNSQSTSMAVGSLDRAILTAFNYAGLHRSSTISWDGPGYTKVWEVKPDGTICPHLGDGNASYSLRVFKSKQSTSGRSSLRAVIDAGAFLTKWGEWWTLAKLLFEEVS